MYGNGHEGMGAQGSRMSKADPRGNRKGGNKVYARDSRPATRMHRRAKRR
jgi:hypothetical protein